MKFFASLLLSILLSASAFSQNGVYLFGYMYNAPNNPVDITVVVYSSPPVTTQFMANPDGSIVNFQNNWVDLPSEDWTHFEVIYPTCENETNIITVNADTLPNMIDVFYTINYCPNGIYGCTDPDANNYNPQATVDDGSCEYDVDCVEIDTNIYCADMSSNEYFIVIQDDPFCCNTQWDIVCQNAYEDLGGQPLPGCDGFETVFGCTDPNAINYNPDANTDDGTCQYSDSCMTNSVVLQIVTAQWGNEMSWVLFHEGDTVAADGGFQDNWIYTTDLCLEDGCYTFEMYDTFGDGWNGGSFLFHYNGTVLTNGTLQTGNFGSVDFGINDSSCDSSNVVMGCTDPNAINYDPNATVNDGSCEYQSEVANDLCADAAELQLGTQLISNVGAVNNENIWGECWAFGSGEGEQTSIWYSFTTPDEPATIHIEASGDGTNTLTDTQFGLFEECGGEMIYCDGNAGQGLFSAFHFECGELEENTTYILMIDGYFGDNGTCNLTYDVSTSCDVLGCTDPEAINYNPNATVDDGSCEYETECTWVTMVLDGPSGIQGFFDLYSNDGYVATGTYAGSDQAYEWCLEDGCYELYFVSGNGGVFNDEIVYTIFMEDSIIDGGSFLNQTSLVNIGINADCDSTVVYGCTDPEAINFNPNANIDDGSCEYEENCTDVTFSFNSASDMQGFIDIYNENEYVIGGLYSGGGFSLTTCLEDGCYDMFLSIGGAFIDTVAYSVSIGDSVITEGVFVQATNEVSFGLNASCEEEVFGCTDPTAINFDPEATVNDGSCVYEECDAYEVLLIITTQMWGNEIGWNISQDGIALEGGEGYSDNIATTHLLCLEDGCYTFEMYDSFGDGWNGGTYTLMLNNGQLLAEGTLEQGNYGSVDFGVNSDGCGEVEIYGCTDPLAINYNPEATIDDGSCEYDNDCVEVGDDYCVDISSEAYFYTITQDSFCCNNAWDQICQDAYIGFGGPLGEDCEIYGCTDPNAINYNPEATIDDGSCEYEFECAISFTVTPDSTGAQVIWITPTTNIANASEVEWDFGDGTTSNELFPIHTYEGDGPYTLCLTAYFEEPNGGFCEITYCAVLTDEMINPPGMSSSGFSINVLNPNLSTGLDEAEQITTLNLWPNPASEMANIEFTLRTGMTVNFEIYDISGKLIESTNFSGNTGKNFQPIDVSDLQPGMYLVRLTSQHEQMTTRMVIR